MKKEKVKKKGIVVESLPNANFLVKLEEDENKKILCHLSGKLRLYRIKILPGDKVSIEISPYDEKRGRITFRY